MSLYALLGDVAFLNEENVSIFHNKYIHNMQLDTRYY